MQPKLQILPPSRRIELVEKSGLSADDRLKLIELIQLEIADKLEGVFPGVSAAVYHHPLCPGLSHSSVSEAVKSGTNWLLSSKWQSQAMKLGSAFHTKALEPHFFQSEFPEGSLSHDDLVAIDGMLSALQSHSAYHQIFNPDLSRLIEVSIFAKCPITGLIRKVRPDVLIAKKAIIDLKTTGASNAEDFQARADGLHYESQVSYYMDTCSFVGLEVPDNYQWAVGRKSPHWVEVFSYDESFLDAGRSRYLQGLENIAALIQQSRAQFKHG